MLLASSLQVREVSTALSGSVRILCLRVSSMLVLGDFLLGAA